LVACFLVLAMVVSVTGLLGATGTSISITSPRPGASVKGTIDVQASVRTDDRISYVILGVDQDRPQSSNSAPFSFTLDTRELTDGPHRIFVEAYDRYGLVGSSTVVRIYVKNGSSSYQFAQKQPEVGVAAAPAPKAEVKTAKAPSAPPARSTTHSAIRPASAAAALATAPDVEANASPMMSGRGPLPAPTRSVAEATIEASRTGTVSSPTRQSVASGPIGAVPPMPSIAVAPSRLRSHMVVLNGQPVAFDVAPRIVDGRVHASFRNMFENQGAQVSWDAQAKIARSIKGALTVEVPVGERIARVNGAAMDMGAQASIVKGRTIVPVRFFAGAIGGSVHWDIATRTALVHTSQTTIAARPDAK
jgi:hypothetical protein